MSWGQGLESEDSERIRLLAAVLIFVGSVLGIMSGLLFCKEIPLTFWPRNSSRPPPQWTCACKCSRQKAATPSKV